MTIKNRFSHLLLLALVLGFSACEETKYDIIPYEGENFFNFTGTNLTIFEDQATPIEIPVTFSTGSKDSGSVDFQITGGTPGVDYEVLNSGTTLSLSEANGYTELIRIQPINNTNSEADVTLEVSLSNPQAGVIGFPGPDNANTAAFKVNILNVCPSIPIEGTHSSSTTGRSTDSCCPDEVTVASSVTITANPDGTYTIDDWSAGIYLQWYGVYGVTADTPLTGIITLNGNEFTISANEPFGTAVTGNGIINPCTKELTYTWSNGYNDTATVTATID